MRKRDTTRFWVDKGEVKYDGQNSPSSKFIRAINPWKLAGLVMRIDDKISKK